MTKPPKESNTETNQFSQYSGIQKLRQDLIAATTDTRRKMTLKYQIEF